MEIATAGILYGTVTVGASLLSRNGVPVLAVSFFFLSLSLIVLAPFAFRKGFASRVKRSSRFLLAYGLIGAFLVLSQFVSLSMGVSPAITALLLYTQPLWTVVFGRLFFSEKIDLSKLGVIVLALSGALFVSNPFSESAQSNLQGTLLVGEVIALLGGVFLSGWIILGKKARLSEFINPAELTFAARGSTLIYVTAICAVAILLGQNHLLGSPTVIYSNFAYLFVFSIVAGVLPDYLFYRGIEKVQSVQAGVILLLEPVSAAILSAALLISDLGMFQIVGGALILLSNYFVIKSE
ncbi:MAG: DMT family transporter [Thaumarchaeota archaeon]|nr:DMT family transporter [Nitrososphaerota archaeon]MCL5068968.1 DMT family transporter [Nitrososphaerota archaeon]MDG6906466.1 DMT family transporter [Nitrososphaerota archaeon]